MNVRHLAEWTAAISPVLPLLACRFILTSHLTDDLQERRVVVERCSRRVVQHDPATALPRHALDALDWGLVLRRVRDELAPERVPGEIVVDAESRSFYIDAPLYAPVANGYTPAVRRSARRRRIFSRAPHVRIEHQARVPLFVVS